MICDGEHNILKTYYRTTRPNIHSKLTKQCRKLTKLTQEEIDASADADEAAAEVCALLKQFGVKQVSVWGNFDRPGLLSDIKQHARARKSASNVSRLLSTVKDIQNETIKKMQLPQAINIKDLASAFDYVPATGAFHNALTDALALYTVHKAVWTTDIYGCEKFVQLKQARLDKIEADKRAAEQRRKELTLLIPLTEREKEFYGTLERIEDKNDYWRLRFRIMNMFQRMPGEERFCFIVLHAPRRTKLTPVSKYSPAKYEGGDMREFSREDFDLILLDEISRKLPVRN
ncbi:Inhibitor of the KinA pathway to sporulation, predicted exonuclease [Ruminococcaceae bacterium FB2012]|nr:Inhibitor of the KinA pathway to sporulation, predicted exonuclease [Ruminococcaceae bacterium FB2012]